MNLNSITTKITLIFSFTFCLLIAVFVFYLKYENEQKNVQVKHYHATISNYLFQNKLPKDDVLKYFETLNFQLEENHQDVLHNGVIIVAKRGFETIVYKKQFYIHVLTPRFRILFKDLTEYKNSAYDYLFFPLIFCLLLFIYLWLIKSLKPLHELKNQIAKFAQGNLDINCASNKNDEIADVANEFDNAVKEIGLLLSSRQLFLRTVMHELKTPIAKGRIVAELIDDTKQKNRLALIFEKLDFLINDFAKIEQIVSKNYELNQHKYSLKEIMHNASIMLMIDSLKDRVTLNIKPDTLLQCDFELLSMAIKNLIDNALKYSEDGKVIIKEENDQLLFISNGLALEKPLSEYFKPFHNETLSKNHGMGLGLYIVKSILNIHKMKFEYEYKNNMNIFKISYN